MNSTRARAEWSATVLRAGSLSAAVLLAAGFVMSLLTVRDAGQLVSLAGVIILLGTPPAALLTTFMELRTNQPRVALLALLVVGTLGLATVLAAFNG